MILAVTWAVGCYGQSSVTSNHLDQLAADSARFDASFCTAPQCSPSRAALYTGRYGHTNGMFRLSHDPFNWRMHDSEIYLAEYLRHAGYQTVHTGIQHVTEFTEVAVEQLGFDEVLPGHLAPELAQSAVNFLERPRERPSFLNIGFFEPHRDDNGGFKVAPPGESKGVNLPSYIPKTSEARQEFSELQGMIRQVDDAVGQIMAALKRSDLLQDTWVIFTTDHGLAVPCAKCTMYDAGIETALIMFAPSLEIIGGKVFDHLISHVDMVPTILEGLRIKCPPHLQGKSYWSLLQGADYEPQRAIRTMQYKLIWNAEVDIINVPADIMHSPIYPQMIHMLAIERPSFELYDLQADPDETNNLADHPDYAHIQDDLRERLLAWMQATDDPILKGPIPSPYYRHAIDLLTGSTRLRLFHLPFPR